MQHHDFQYMAAVDHVLKNTKAYAPRGVRNAFKKVELATGVPFQFAGRPVQGPQCTTVSLRIRDQDLATVEGLGERLAHRAGSQMARVYRDLSVVRIEFNLPRNQWREVALGNLPHHRGQVTIGQRALGPVARVAWDSPHKAIFGGTQTGKSTCMVDMILSVARTNEPVECQVLILNPKNDEKFQPFARLPHLAAKVAVGYEDCAGLLRFALAEMEKRRQPGGEHRKAVRWVIFIDEIAQLTEMAPETGPMVTMLSQLAGGLNINLVVASQAANPSTYGSKGSLAQANFSSRIVFQLPNDQAWLAAKVKGLNTGGLGGDGDAYAVNQGRVTRIRAAWPTEADYAGLAWRETEPPTPDPEDMAGDVALSWNVEELADRLGYALAVRDSATALQKEFGGAMDRARWVRDLAGLLKERMSYWEGAAQ